MLPPWAQRFHCIFTVLQPPHGVDNVLCIDDVIAVKHRSCFVATNLHGYLFVHAHFHQILDS